MDDLRRDIERLELEARKLEPDADQRLEWTRLVGEFASQFVADLDQRPTFVPGPPAPAAPFSAPTDPALFSELLQRFQREVLDRGLNPASGGHLGYIPGGGLFPCALGDYLAAVTNQYAGVYFAGPGAVRMEHDLVRWMCRMVGYPENALGNLTSGGSIANLIAFVAARDALKIRAEQIRQSVIYLTEQVHHCVYKAIRIGGMAEAVVRTVGVDQNFRMDADQLRSMVAQDKRAGLRPFLIVASAGTTDTGAIDPLDAIADVSKQSGMWLHVDAAYGGFFLLSTATDSRGVPVASRLRGIERSDSVAIDPHKGLFLSYGIGAVLFQDVSALQESHYYRASYLQDAFSAVEEPNPADLSPELTKHFRGLRMWLPLQLFGIRPFVAALNEKIQLCRYFYHEVQNLGFEVGPEPELSVCLYRYVPTTGDPNEFNRRLVEAIHRDGKVFVSSTTIGGAVWLRLAVLCFRTHLSQIDYLLGRLKEWIGELESAG